MIWRSGSTRSSLRTQTFSSPLRAFASLLFRMTPRPALRTDRRDFLRLAAGAAVTAGLGTTDVPRAQVPGERPVRVAGVEVLNPRTRVPVGLIIDDSTCLVNLNRFAMPQFNEAFAGAAAVYHRPWRDWPAEIPDAFVRTFGEWCAEAGVKGKYSIVPHPACVGRLDRMLPGWTPKELRESIELVRTLMTPNWDIHPEMVTHTRVIDLKTGHPYPELSPKFMENWEWTTGRSADEIGAYQAYALGILKEIGLPCEGITTPGSFGNKALPQLAQATLQSVRSVFGAEIPHYFRHMFTEGSESVAPRVEYASGLDGPDPRCVVSIIAGAGDWTGGWDCTNPGGADKFISEDGRHGRMVDLIARGEPALMLAHWTGIYFNGYEVGFNIFKEVVKRLHAHYDHLLWMKLSEVSRYWAARELTRLARTPNAVAFRAPFACADFTVRTDATITRAPRLLSGATVTELKEVGGPLELAANTWCRDARRVTACFALPKGESRLALD